MSYSFLGRSQYRLLFLLAGLILSSLRASRRNPCFPFHLVVAKWLANFSSYSTRCRMEWRLGCLTMASIGTDSILPLAILVMAVTVVVIVAVVVPFVHYRE